MHITELKIKQGKKIRGSGTDAVGEYEIKGKKVKDDGFVKFTKKYIGQHEVKYEGQIQGNEIVGHWKYND